MLLHAGLNLSMAVIAPDSWWFPILTLAAGAAVVALFGARDLGRLPRVSLPPATLGTEGAAR
ncbi:hypothetical protein [Propionicimonas sp. T2.31MG-18]|uniref:hypothetical protein n=1 Tax=Propionicimonas sp. T2.31MG-18 TaxID=3157620 RepID=UPI00366F1A08